MGGCACNSPTDHCSWSCLVAHSDASADTFRKALLCFPIGLLAMYGTSGLLFVVQAWSVTNLPCTRSYQRIIDCFLFRKVHVERTTYTQWQKMEAQFMASFLVKVSLKLNRKLLRSNGSKATEIHCCRLQRVLLSSYTGPNHDV